MDHEPSQDLHAAPPVDHRVFTEGRAAQGFRDQDHLDRFYAYYDHVQAGVAARPDGCGCGLPGPGHEGADGWQPDQIICPEGQRLSEAVPYRDRTEAAG